MIKLRITSLKQLFLRMKDKKIRVEKKYNLKLLISIFMKLSSVLKIKKCLTLSIALFNFLKFNGYSPSFNIGVRKDKKFSSHAWIDCESSTFYFDDSIKFNSIHKIT